MEKGEVAKFSHAEFMNYVLQQIITQFIQNSVTVAEFCSYIKGKQNS
jgi:hypothetical protein